MPKCAVCKKEVLPRKENKGFPFCSERCRLVDLGKWLGEEYRVAGPAAGMDDPEDEDGKSAVSEEGGDER